MRAWIEDVDDETVAFVHKAEGADLDRLITYCREKAENEKSRHDMKHVASVDQAVIIDWEKGTLTGASDHRKDGCALGY